MGVVLASPFLFMNMKILIVEDELLIQQSLKKLLSSKGAEVIACSRGQAGIQEILSHHFDRIVCDLMLQDITGFDVIEESKKKYSEEDIKKKFIIMTAYSSDNIIDKANGYGCAFLKKPFDLNTAIETIMGEQ